METTSVSRNPDPAQNLSAAATDAAEAILKTAIEAHMRWKESLERYVEGANYKQLNPDLTPSDTHCLLGQWIHTEGQSHFGHLRVFQSLIRAHAEFHSQAAAILASMQRGEAADAMQRLQIGDYPKASAQVKSLLAQLYVEILCQHPRPSRFAGYL